MTIIAILGVLILAAECQCKLDLYLKSNPMADAMLQQAIRQKFPLVGVDLRHFLVA